MKHGITLEISRQWSLHDVIFHQSASSIEVSARAMIHAHAHDNLIGINKVSGVSDVIGTQRVIFKLLVEIPSKIYQDEHT